jgi:hypothetical protein
MDFQFGIHIDFWRKTLQLTVKLIFLVINKELWRIAELY